MSHSEPDTFSRRCFAKRLGVLGTAISIGSTTAAAADRNAPPVDAIGNIIPGFEVNEPGAASGPWEPVSDRKFVSASPVLGFVSSAPSLAFRIILMSVSQQ
jgi:hypothetical protein